MARVTEIKFFEKDGELFIALFAEPPAFWCTEYWLKNVKASEYGVKTLPEGLKLEKKYNAARLNMQDLESHDEGYGLHQVGGNFAGFALKSLFGQIF